MISGILAILVGLGYTGYWVGELAEGADALTGALFVLATLPSVVGGVLMLIRQRMGIVLANAGAAAALYFAVVTSIKALIRMDFDDGAYFSLPILALILVLLVLVNVPSTRAGTHPPRPGPPSPLPVVTAVVAGVLGVLILATAGYALAEYGFGVKLPSTLAAAALLLAGGVLMIINRNVTALILAALGAGLAIGPTEVTGHLGFVATVVGAVIGLALAVLLGLPAVDRAVTTRTQRPGNQPPWNQPPGPPPGNQPPGNQPQYGWQPGTR